MSPFLFALYFCPFLVSSQPSNPALANVSCTGVDSVGSSPGMYNHLSTESPNPTAFIVLAFVFGVILLLICGASFDCCKSVCGCIHDPFWACLKAYSTGGDDDEALGTKRLVAVIYFLLTGAIGIGLWQAYQQTGVAQGTWIQKDMLLCWKGVFPYCTNCGAPYRPEVVVRYFDDKDTLVTVRTCPELPCEVLRSNDDGMKVIARYTVGQIYTGSVTSEDQTVAYLTISSTSLLKVLGAIFFVLFSILGVGLLMSYICGCMGPKRDATSVHRAFD